jgi:hypothetical protein
VAAKSDVPDIATLVCKVVLVAVLGEQAGNCLQMVIIFYGLSWNQLNGGISDEGHDESLIVEGLRGENLRVETLKA